MANKGTNKTLEKLNESVNNGNYYEAHQMYRTIARRYNKQLKYTKAIYLLHEGAMSLMRHKQSASGSDLANYMIDTYITAKIPVDEKSLDRVVELLSVYPTDEPGRKPFLKNAFRWTQQCGDFKEGDPELHDYVGVMLLHEGRYALAEEHLLLGTDNSAVVLGKLAHAWSQSEQVPYKGIFIARIVLQLLAIKNIHHANLALMSYLETAHPSYKTCAKLRQAPAEDPVEQPVYEDTWLNFCQLVLLTVRRDASDLFRNLKETYATMYQSHKGFDELLDDIGFVFFNIPKPRKQKSVLQDLMSSLFSATPTDTKSNAQSSSNMELD